MLHIKNLQPVTMKAQREKKYEKQEVGTLKKKRRGWKICLCGGGGTHNAILITLVQINFQRQVVLRDRVRKNNDLR